MKLIARLAIVLLTLLIAYKSLIYFQFNIAGILLEKGGVVKNRAYLTMFYSHVGFGTIALVSGPWQFFSKLRNRFMFTHRAIGKLYVASCLISAIGGFCISFFAFGGLLAKSGFGLLSVVWFIISYKAFKYIKKGLVKEHKEWMVLSFALTFAAFTFRMWLGLLIELFGFEYYSAYGIAAWLAWIPNLIIALFINRFSK